MATLNPTTFVDQIRLQVGDVNKNDPIMSDAIYTWFYTTNGNSVLKASIAALESLINQIALDPSAWDVGDVGARGTTVSTLEKRLNTLKAKESGNKTPMVIKSDRTNWDDFNKLYGDC